MRSGDRGVRDRERKRKRQQKTERERKTGKEREGGREHISTVMNQVSDNSYSCMIYNTDIDSCKKSICLLTY